LHISPPAQSAFVLQPPGGRIATHWHKVPSHCVPSGQNWFWTQGFEQLPKQLGGGQGWPGAQAEPEQPTMHWPPPQSASV